MTISDHENYILVDFKFMGSRHFNQSVSSFMTAVSRSTTFFSSFPH